MGILTYQDLCIDANDAAALGAFWARTIGLRPEQLDNGHLVLKDPADPALGSRAVWINTVPEPRTVKQRVHLDVRAATLDELGDLPRLTEPGQLPWTVLADPEGGELCAFTPDAPGDAVPGYRLKAVVVDSADPERVAGWWQELLGGELTSHRAGESWWLEGAAGVPFETFVFARVPEPKTVKNRIHWDVTLAPGATPDDLTARGATVLRAQDDEIHWTVMADVEGNEFCAFTS